VTGNTELRAATAPRSHSPFTGSGYWFAAMLALAGLAFWPRYLGRVGDGIDGYTHVHAVLMTAWVLLLVSQPLLIRAGRHSLHRSLGRASYVLCPLIVLVSLLLTHQRMRSLPDEVFAAEAANYYLPLSMIAVFVIAYALAIRFRRDMALHARYMICTGLTIIDPVLGRILGFYLPPFSEPLAYQAITFGLTDLVLIGLILRERSATRGRQAFPLMLGVFVLVHGMWFTFAQTGPWVQLMERMRAL
jgi:F0F1-type ATP synthase assembly protein I